MRKGKKEWRTKERKVKTKYSYGTEEEEERGGVGER